MLVEESLSESLLIGFLGADWWGSDALATASELRRRGHLLVERHYEDFLPTRWRSSPLRIVRRLLRPMISREYNLAVQELLSIDAMQMLVVFKGMLLSPETLGKFRERGVRCYCIYPDVSFEAHGRNIGECLPLYDAVFTTKTFHLEEQRIRSRTQRLIAVPHGCDPAVHRVVLPSAELLRSYGCDASFVGAWSPKKERMLTALMTALPDLTLHIWGPSWHYSSPGLQKHWRGRGAWGDELAAIYQCSRINLGLLSEAGAGTQSGDRTTARTWQIPACASFLLHEDSEELRQAFAVDEEVGVFRDEHNLAEQVRYWLEHDDLRQRVAANGGLRVRNSVYTYSRAVTELLRFHAEWQGSQ